MSDRAQERRKEEKKRYKAEDRMSQNGEKSENKEDKRRTKLEAKYKKTRTEEAI